MKKIKGYVSLSLQGCKKEFEFEVEDDTGESDIEDMAKEEMFNLIEWGWEKVE